MLQVLIYSLVFGYAVSLEAADLPPDSCLNNGDCANNQCCFMNTLVISKKRAVSSILPIYGTCQTYLQEGESCGGSGCGCEPGLTCEDGPLIASRAVEENSTSSSRLIAPFPSFGVCSRPSADPSAQGKTCFNTSDCPQNQCCSFRSRFDVIISKRIVLATGVCRPYRRQGQPCSGYCGCAPGLICDNSFPISPPINSRAVAADSADLILYLRGTCRKP